MNRYHMSILFGGIALVLFSLVTIRASTIKKQDKAVEQLQNMLQFAISGATTALSSEYGGASDCQNMSDTFFKSLSIMNSDNSIYNGRVLPADFYPYVPVMLYADERTYSIGYFDGTAYVWEQDLPYSEEYPVLSELATEKVISLLEQKISIKVDTYHDKMNLPDTSYTIPSYTMRNFKQGTLLVVLENFPTILYGHYYSGVYGGAGSIKK